MTEFQDNIWHDNRHVELSIGELEGLPTAYVATHSVTETTGKVLIFGKLANICPNLDYCRVQTTRAKVMRLQHNLASPVNEAGLKRLLDLRREKAKLPGYIDWAEYQLEKYDDKKPRRSSGFPR